MSTLRTVALKTIALKIFVLGTIISLAACGDIEPSAVDENEIREANQQRDHIMWERTWRHKRAPDAAQTNSTLPTRRST